MAEITHERIATPAEIHQALAQTRATIIDARAAEHAAEQAGQRAVAMAEHQRLESARAYADRLLDDLHIVSQRRPSEP